MHRGLLEELDTDLERTEGRLGRARRGLERVGRGVKGNGECSLFCYLPRKQREKWIVDVDYLVGSTVAIGVLIFVLLVLIIVFKT